MISNTHDTIRDGHRGKGGATRECTTSYTYHAIGNSNGGEGAAPIESIISNTRYTIRNGHGGKGKPIESPTSNARYAIGDNRILTTCYKRISRSLNNRITILTTIVGGITTFYYHRGEGVATSESTLANTLNAIRDGDRCEGRTIGESTLAYTLNAIRDSDGVEIGAISESLLSNACYAVRNNRILTARYECISCRSDDGITIFTTIIFCVATFYYHGGEVGATPESTFSNANYAIRDSDRGERCATSESMTSNASYIIRDGHRGEETATRECTTSYTYHAIGNSKGGEGEALIKSIISNARYAIGDNRILTTYYKRISLSFYNRITILTAIVSCITTFHPYSLKGITNRESQLSNNRYALGDGYRGEGFARKESRTTNARYRTIESDDTLSVFVGIANDVGTEDIGFVWSNDIAIGGGVEDLPCWVDGWSVFLPLGIQRTCPISRDSG